MTSNTNLNEKWYETEVGHGIISKKYFHDGEKSFEEMAERISSCFSLKLKDKVKQALYNADFFPGGRSLYALGCKGKFTASTSNCYVLPSASDNIESIMDVGKQMAKIFSRGGGTGINLSNLRPRGAKVNNVARTSTGAVSFMEIYNTIGGVISQNGRRGALLIGLNINHPDVEEFVNVKQDNVSIQSANISVLIDDKFMEAVKSGAEYKLEFVVKDKNGAEKDKIIKYIDAKDFFEKICASNLDYAEPGIIFQNRVDKWHLLSEDKEYKIDICNP